MKTPFGKNGDLIKTTAIGAAYLSAVIVFAVVDAQVFVRFAVFAVLAVAVGVETAADAVKEFRKEPFNENVLMLVAAAGAFAIGEFAEGVAVLYFFSVGELFEEYADRRSKNAIESLYKMMSDYATVIRDGVSVEVDVSAIAAGDEMLVKAGERVAADGILDSDEAYFDTSMITGESKPRRIERGDAVRSGYIAIGAPATVVAERPAELSSAAKIIELIKDAESKKTKSEKFITDFAKIYTPIVILLAAVFAIVPSVVTGEYVLWIKRALNLLVISCPCALVVSVPIAFFVGVGKAFERGIIVRGSATLERISNVKTFVFDKTGTLTEGRFEVKSVYPQDKRDEILKIAASLEKYSSHPIAKAISSYYKGETYFVEDVKEIAGNGIIARLFGKIVIVGNARLMERYGYNIACEETGDTPVFVAFGNTSGYVVIGDRSKPGAKELIGKLKADGKKTVMLTGDNERCAAAYSRELGIGLFQAELTPEEKVAKLDELKKSGKIAFVGDGINDAPVIASADVSVAMGSGSDVTQDMADVVITDDEIKKVGVLRRIAKKTMSVVYANMIFSIAVKVALFALSITGVVPLWLAVFGDVGVMIVATLNSFALSMTKNF